MREIRNILSAYDRLVADGECAVLASVVAVDGSTYRRPGARSLILPDETSVGLVSGGCLEGDLILRAREVQGDGAPRLAHYDSSAESDIVWGLGLGCAGSVEVLLERVDAQSPGPLARLRECLGARSAGVIATPLGPLGTNASAVSEGLSQRLSQRMGIQPQGGFTGSAPSAGETQWVEAQARSCLAAGRSGIRRFPAASGSQELSYLFEYVLPPVRLLVFGTGADAVPLVQLAGSLGWNVVAIDNRGARASLSHFSSIAASSRLELVELVELVARKTRRWIGEIGLDDRTAAVVMTHHYLDDREILGALLATPIRYVGLLGPRKRGDKLLSDLTAEGALPTSGRPPQLFSPAGLDVGADSPVQIALAVAAEIQAVFSERGGGWLREREGPIHDPIATDDSTSP